ncbi:MurR/RpiR family transcriptional regulator [Mycoplasmatota bacterium WC30]
MISKININIINSLSHLEIEALRYIESHKKDVIEQSIQQISDCSYISTATIMRLCKKLGYTGFTEFKYNLKREMESNKNDTFDSFEELINDNILTVTETAKMLSPQTVMKVIEEMVNSKHIHFFAKGLSGNVLLYASKLLLTNGVVNSFYEDTHIAHIAAEKMGDRDVLFLASLSGETSQVVQMAQIAKSKNAVIVTITGNTSNELAKLGTYSFGFYRDKYTVRPSDVSSRLQVLFILNIILKLYFNKNIKEV